MGDVVVRNEERLSLLRGNRQRTLEPDAPFLSIDGAYPATVEVGDASCDGYDDVLVGSGRRSALHLGSRAGVAETPSWTIDERLVPIFD